MKLVVNGDDLGYTKANTLGIIEAYERGILRSTTALVNSPYLQFAAKACQNLSGLGIGVHLTLTLGRPLTQNRTLSKDDGTFLSREEVRTAKLDPDEVYREWDAQVERFIEVFGRRPTHLDSHHSVHLLNKQQVAVAKRLAAEYSLPMRCFGPFDLVRGFWGEAATAEGLISLISHNSGKDIEIMCHPGYCDLELYRHSSYSWQRVQELDALCDPSVLTYVRSRGVELVHY